MAPRRPKSAPDAPTDTVLDLASCKCKIDSKLPPIPEIIYKSPILTAKSTEKNLTKENHRGSIQSVKIFISKD